MRQAHASDSRGTGAERVPHRTKSGLNDPKAQMRVTDPECPATAALPRQQPAVLEEAGRAAPAGESEEAHLTAAIAQMDEAIAVTVGGEGVDVGRQQGK
jgi:hypothetical protein